VKPSSGRKLTAIPEARGCPRTLRRSGDSQEAREELTAYYGDQYANNLY